jgi:hypothetical protein
VAAATKNTEEIEMKDGTINEMKEGGIEEVTEDNKVASTAEQ